MTFLYKQTNVIIQKPGSSGSGGDGLIIPPEGWYELSSTENPTLDIGLHADGFHDYSVDVAVGPSGGTAATLEHSVTGLRVLTGAAQQSAFIIHACSCSMELNPIVSMIFKTTSLQSSFYLGVASEDVSDNVIGASDNIRIGTKFDRATTAIVYTVAREEAAISTGVAPNNVVSDYIQVDFEPSDYGYVKAWILADGTVGSRDPGGAGFLDTVFGFDANLPGSVIAPFFSNGEIALGAYLVAVRITTRRTI